MGYFDKTIEFIKNTPIDELMEKMKKYGVKFVKNPNYKGEDKMIKDQIVEFLLYNSQSGFYAEEIADNIEAKIEDVEKVLKDNKDMFYYDKENPYIGWRINIK